MIFSTNGPGTVWYPYGEKLPLTLTSEHIQNLKWKAKDIYTKAKTEKLLEEKIGENLHDLEFSDEWLHITAQVWYVKEKINKLDFTKIKNPALRKNLL